jgi:predicted TPR repeat methyltransferase
MLLLEPARRVVRRTRQLRLGRRSSLERFYATAYDPFGIDTNPYESEKFDDLLQVMGEGPFARGLEVGCSIGSLTERLAARCEQLLALDIAQAAVDRTRERLAGQPHVVVERRTIPQELPDGPFDLVVCADVLYYLPRRRLRRTLQELAARLAPGGTIVSLHWLGEHGAPTAGHAVHDLQEQLWSGLTHVAREERVGVGPHGAGYRLDRYDRPGH